ncbi:pheromone-binding protein Gp-9-like isoform X1 [Ceratina calcarata]|uniref:Pheromone-binding protein Gp-9-like isoform X1 n=1 Tax=Ceratina calcarata TaxID=156304 RepID=A0AAJ7W8F6_9HYME|nr:pheromone-binding protein Gp-9-like isoform X1 [Ceratina calcarata]
MIASLTEMWSIPRNEVEVCTGQTKVTYDDFMLFVDVIQSEGENNDTVRKASCTLACCAQAQGTMSGTNINMAAVHNLITNSSAPHVVKPRLHIAVDTCAELVKNINDGCDKFLQFIMCVCDDKWKITSY